MLVSPSNHIVLFARGRLIRPVNVETSCSIYDSITQAKCHKTLESASEDFQPLKKKTILLNSRTSRLALAWL